MSVSTGWRQYICKKENVAFESFRRLLTILNNFGILVEKKVVVWGENTDVLNNEH